MLDEIGGPLPSPLRVGGDFLRERRGLILRLSDGTHAGAGEASPLPGYCDDTLGAARAALATLASDQLAAALAEIDVRRAWECLPRLPSASAQHALETAVWSLFASRARTTPAELLRPSAAPPSLCALLPATDMRAAAEAARCSGAVAVKAKIGTDIARELRELCELRRAWPAVELRLDGNRRFSSSEALAEFAALSPRFIEEPLAGGVRQPVSLPLAADETLQHDDAVLDEIPLAAAILKPMTLGGPARCLALADRAAARGIAVVLSHSFDGPVARSHALALAAVLPGVAAGLMPHSALAVLSC
jgi:o-succinylbenzoate synthase